MAGAALSAGRGHCDHVPFRAAGAALPAKELQALPEILQRVANYAAVAHDGPSQMEGS